jgi:hypothetical protein
MSKKQFPFYERFSMISRTALLALIGLGISISTSAQARVEARTEIVRDEINKKRQEVERFDPAVSEKFVERGFKDWVLLSVSPKARAEYYKNDEVPASQQSILDPVFAKLGAAVKEKLAFYKPRAGYFAYRSPSDERLMMGQLRESATRRVLKIGLAQANWEIYKDSIGLPSYRFKRGYILAKDSADDHQFCKLYYISIVQDYAGGGRYAASQAKYEETNLAGCP